MLKEVKNWVHMRTYGLGVPNLWECLEDTYEGVRISIWNFNQTVSPW